MGKGQTLDRLRVEEVCTETFLSGPQEARGRLLPFSCMQENQLIIRVCRLRRRGHGGAVLSCSAGQTHTTMMRVRCCSSAETGALCVPHVGQI